MLGGEAEIKVPIAVKISFSTVLLFLLFAFWLTAFSGADLTAGALIVRVSTTAERRRRTKTIITAMIADESINRPKLGAKKVVVVKVIVRAGFLGRFGFCRFFVRDGGETVRNFRIAFFGSPK